MNVGVLTISDRSSSGERVDTSGELIASWCAESNFTVERRAIIPDETPLIVATLTAWADGGLGLIVTTGGTGLSPRDVTPEATKAVIDREIPGIAEEMRRRGRDSTPFSSLSRGVVGARGATLIVNLPGSPGGVTDGLDVLTLIVAHAVALLGGETPSHKPSGG
jgi:molybdenum cofactor synthesis domain-containing protein